MGAVKIHICQDGEQVYWYRFVDEEHRKDWHARVVVDEATADRWIEAIAAYEQCQEEMGRAFLIGQRARHRWRQPITLGTG